MAGGPIKMTLKFNTVTNQIQKRDLDVGSWREEKVRGV